MNSTESLLQTVIVIDSDEEVEEEEEPQIIMELGDNVESNHEQKRSRSMPIREPNSIIDLTNNNEPYDLTSEDPTEATEVQSHEMLFHFDPLPISVSLNSDWRPSFFLRRTDGRYNRPFRDTHRHTQHIGSNCPYDRSENYRRDCNIIMIQNSPIPHNHHHPHSPQLSASEEDTTKSTQPQQNTLSSTTDSSSSSSNSSTNPKRPLGSCNICQESLGNGGGGVMSLKCGHVYCGTCILNALSYAARCPTCRTRASPASLIRLYL